MAKQTIDIVRRYIADVTGFKSGMDQLVQSSKKSTDALNKVNASTKKISETTSDFASALKGLVAGFSAVSVGKFLVSIQSMDAALKGAAGSQADFARALQTTAAIADRYGLSQQSITKGYASFLSAGMGAGQSLAEIEKQFEALAVAAAAFQLTASDLDGVILGWQQTLGNATINMEDLRQVVDRIPGGMNLAVKAMRELGGNAVLTGGEFKKMVADGKVLTQEFLPALSKQFFDSFGKAAAENASTAAAEMNRFDNAVLELGRTMAGSGILTWLASAAKGLGQLVGGLNSAISPMKSFQSFLANMDENFNPSAINGVTELNQKIIEAEDNAKRFAEASKSWSIFGNREADAALANLWKQEADRLKIQLDALTKAAADNRAAARKMAEEARASAALTADSIAGADVVDRLSKALKLTDAAKANLASFLPTIVKAAEETGIRATTLISKIYSESRFANFSAGNKSSAMGPSQITEGTARTLAKQYKLDFEALRTGSDGWVQNIQAGALYLRDMMKSARTETEGMAKYFLGPNKVASAGIDVTSGNNGGLTGRQYADNAFKTEEKIIDALEGTKLAAEGAAAGVDRFRNAYRGALATQEQYQAAQDTFKQRMAELETQFQTGALSLDAYNRAALAAVEALVQVDPAAQKLTETQKLQIQVTTQAIDAYQGLLAQYDPLIAATQEYNAAMVTLDLAVAALNLSEQKRAELAGKITAAYQRNTAEIKKTGDSIEGLALRMQDAAFQSFGSWIDSAVQGTFKFKDAIASLIKELAAMAAKMAILSAVKAMFPGASIPGFANGGYGQFALPQGIYTQPMGFAMPGSGQFRRFATGGVFAEAGPEAIMPLARMSNGKLGVTAEAAAPVINIYNQATEDGYQASSTTNRKGEIDVVISRIVQDVSRGGNHLARAFEGAYKLQRTR